MGCFAIRWSSSTGSCFPLFDLGLTCLAPLRWPTSSCTLRGSALPSSVAFWVGWIPRLARHRWRGRGSRSSGCRLVACWILRPSLRCLPTGTQRCRPRRLGGVAQPVAHPAEAAEALLLWLVGGDGSFEPLADAEAVILPRILPAERVAGCGFDFLFAPATAAVNAALPAAPHCHGARD